MVVMVAILIMTTIIDDDTNDDCINVSDDINDSGDERSDIDSSGVKSDCGNDSYESCIDSGGRDIDGDDNNR